MTAPYEKAKLAGYDVEPNGFIAGGWIARDPEGEEIAEGLPTKAAAWEACDNHRVFGHVLGARGELIAAGYDVKAARPDAPWAALFKGEVFAESLDSEASAWGMCEEHKAGALAPTAPKAEPVETRRVIVLSTSHLSLATCELLSTASPFPLYGAALPDGFYFSACVRRDNPKTPADVQAVMDFAHARGFDYVQTDTEGPEVEGLPVYDHDPREPVDALEAFGKVRDLFDTWEGWKVYSDGYSPADLLEAIAIAVGAALNDKPAAPVKPDAAANCARYMDALDDLEIPPNGDDCNALYLLALGGDYQPPHKTGR